MGYKLVLSALPIAGSVLYLTYHHGALSRKISCRTTPHLQDQTLPIPSTVKDNPEKYIVHHECAQKSVPTASLGASSPSSSLVKQLIRTTMTTFSRYPPAWGIWYMLKSAEDRRTFDPTYIRSLDFAPGDRVCGVYVVRSSDAAHIVLDLDAPESYAGPRVDGLLAVEIREEDGSTVFMNHTVMWREKGMGSSGVLESKFGRWMHAFMVRGLLNGGVTQLLAETGKKKAL
jgi:hypothetical protein